MKGLDALDCASRFQVGVMAFECVHAHVAHEDCESGDEAGVTVLEGVEVPTHFVERVVGHGLRVFFETGQIVGVEFPEFDPGCADEAASDTAREVWIRRGCDGGFAFELFVRFWSAPGDLEKSLPSCVEALDPDGHEMRVVFAGGGEENDVAAFPRDHGGIDFVLVPFLGLECERAIVQGFAWSDLCGEVEAGSEGEEHDG